MARNAAAVCLAAVLLRLAVSAAAAMLTAVRESGLAGAEETSYLLPARHGGDKEAKEDCKAGRGRGATAGDVASLASAEEGGKEVGSDWDEPKKLDGGDESDSDSDSVSDSDSCSRDTSDV